MCSCVKVGIFDSYFLIPSDVLLPSSSTERNVSVGSLVLAVQILSSFFQSGSELFTGSKNSGSFPKSFTAPCG